MRCFWLLFNMWLCKKAAIIAKFLGLGAFKWAAPTFWDMSFTGDAKNMAKGWLEN